VVVLAFGASAKAEDLAMPFACGFENAALEVRPAAEMTYRILGPRDEQPFSWCQPGEASRCQTMMVHRFMISCGGQKVAWARVAEAARRTGVEMPAGLPPGFAPVGSMSGRFIFPALTSAGRHVPPPVTTQALSADSVIERPDDALPVETATWQTHVSADALPEAPGNAWRVALALSGALMLLLAASLIAAGRWRLPQAAALRGAWPSSFAASAFLKAATGAVTRWADALSKMWVSATAEPADDALANAIAMVHARLAETELAVATLPPDLLLRDVLSAEVQRVRERIFTVEKDMRRRPAEKTAATVRVLLRELERIQRISHSASVSGRASDMPQAGAEIEMPRSVAEAYRILGINPDAAPAAAKKLIDALRMSWHPDYARDEADRRRREERMKQINAAWDMINGRRAAA
jgi:hypothetical protein